jgi:hypothetical protein
MLTDFPEQTMGCHPGLVPESPYVFGILPLTRKAKGSESQNNKTQKTLEDYFVKIIFFTEVKVSAFNL